MMPFTRLAMAPDPWLEQVVFIGGWCHSLYRRHPDAQELDYPPLLTLDTDIAIPPRLSAGKRDIRSRFLDHGFTEEFFGDDRPPATHYRLGDSASGFYVEFLTPLTGGNLDRKGGRKAMIEVAGIAAQRLRHIELPLRNPWTISFEAEGFVTGIRIANPVSFVAQKVLIQEERGRQDRAKDILYMHDTLEVFGGRLPKLREMWRNTVAPALHPRQAGKVKRAAAVLFGKLSDDVRRAAEASGEPSRRLPLRLRPGIR